MTSLKAFLLVIVLCVVFIGGCGLLVGSTVNEDKSVNLLEDLGYTDIHLESKDPFLASLKGCGEDDVVYFKFTATNPAGREVEVETCQGFIFKGATLRGN